MKRLFYAVTVFAALSMAACGKEDNPSTPSAPTIAMDGENIDEVHEITGAPMKVKVDVTAEGGIDKFSVKIESPILTDELLLKWGSRRRWNLRLPRTSPCRRR